MTANASTPEPHAAQRLPRWARILATLAAATIVMGGVFGAGTIAWMRKVTLDAVNPKYIAAALKKVGDFPDSALSERPPMAAVCLPRLMGVGNDGTMIFYGEDANKVQMNLLAFTSPDSDPDPNEFIDFFYENLVIFPKITGRCQSIVDKGKADINGHQLFYQLVVLKDLNDPSSLRNPNSAGIEYSGDRALAAEPGKSESAAATIENAGSKTEDTKAGASNQPATTGGAEQPAAGSTAGAAKKTFPDVPASFKGLIGCMTVGRKVIVVEAAAPRDRRLDIDLISDFLRKARSF